MRACLEMQSALFSGFVAAIYGMTVCPEAWTTRSPPSFPPAGVGGREGAPFLSGMQVRRWASLSCQTRILHVDT